MHPIPYDPAQHRVIDTAFGRYLKDHIGDPLLFTYHHQRTKNWMVAAWVTCPYGKLLELAVLGKEPTGTRGIVQSIESMVLSNPESQKIRKENVRLGKTLMKRWDEEELEQTKETADAIEFLRRKGRHEKKHFVVNA